MPATVSQAPFLRAYPPGYARTTAWLIVAIAVSAIVFCVRVRFPVTLDGPFTIEKELACAAPNPAGCRRLLGQIEFPERAFAYVALGQHIKLYYDALPLDRWGSRSGTIVEAVIEKGHLRVGFETTPVVVSGAAGSVVLAAGATGIARLIVKRQTLFQRALEPLREMRARYGEPATESER